MVNKIMSGTIIGVECQIIYIEVDASNGLPCFELIGMLGTDVKEAKDRVRVALKNNGISIPPLRLTVNLSPANIRKEGTQFDLPIAVGVLASLEIINVSDTEGILFAGELGLNGEVKSIAGVISMVIEAKENGADYVIIPYENLNEALSVAGINIFGAKDINDVINFLKLDKAGRINRCLEIRKEYNYSKENIAGENIIDFSDVAGQEHAKRAMLLGASGFHNILMVGPPGAGKSMVAKRLTTIMPELSENEKIEVTKIYSVSRLLNGKGIMSDRPFVSPHHTVTDVAMAGGGRIPTPGLISRAHKGVLFLDEIVHFSSNSMEILRQPLENKKILVSRTYGNYEFPANFMLVAAMNPCPCGYYPDLNKCKCTPEMIRRYLGKLSGPIIDRIDICIEMGIPKLSELESKAHKISSKEMKTKVNEAIEMQKERYKGTDITFNSELGPKEINEYISLNEKEKELISSLYIKMGLSARGYHRLLKLSRTIADVDGEVDINSKHILEAACYRNITEKYWGI